jgi:hypothetical protein
MPDEVSPEVPSGDALFWRGKLLATGRVSGESAAGFAASAVKG